MGVGEEEEEVELAVGMEEEEGEGEGEGEGEEGEERTPSPPGGQSLFCVEPCTAVEAIREHLTLRESILTESTII